MPTTRQISLAMAAAVALIAALLGASVALYFATSDREIDPERRSETEVPVPAAPAGDEIGAFGTIASKQADSIVLDSRSGRITVEVDDSSPLYRETSMLRVGERVAVLGVADGHGRIEARSIFVEALPEPIRADPADEEGRKDGGR